MSITVWSQGGRDCEYEGDQVRRKSASSLHRLHTDRSNPAFSEIVELSASNLEFKDRTLDEGEQDDEDDFYLPGKENFVSLITLRIGYTLAWYRDPQPVQQDEPDHDPSIEENHFTDYDTSGDILDTTIDGPPSHLTSPTCGYTTITISVPKSTATTP
ncbi:hypothetical protein BDR06DRAFT_1005221 [Suillus hirtellus]|nr:hypothetical protein BDR06DRAFT_1005221 [Suillus hirtellus]